MVYDNSKIGKLAKNASMMRDFKPHVHSMILEESTMSSADRRTRKDELLAHAHTSKSSSMKK